MKKAIRASAYVLHINSYTLRAMSSTEDTKIHIDGQRDNAKRLSMLMYVHICMYR